jgi:hypothetical protein
LGKNFSLKRDSIIKPRRTSKKIERKFRTRAALWTRNPNNGLGEAHDVDFGGNVFFK